MPCFTTHTFMHQDDYILGHNGIFPTSFISHYHHHYCHHPPPPPTILKFYPTSASNTQQHETDTVFTPVQDDSNLRQPAK